jgi:hypothetical protein
MTEFEFPVLGADGQFSPDAILAWCVKTKHGLQHFPDKAAKTLIKNVCFADGAVAALIAHISGRKKPLPDFTYPATLNLRAATDAAVAARNAHHLAFVESVRAAVSSDTADSCLAVIKSLVFESANKQTFSSSDAAVFTFLVASTEAKFEPAVYAAIPPAIKVKALLSCFPSALQFALEERYSPATDGDPDTTAAVLRRLTEVCALAESARPLIDATAVPASWYKPVLPSAPESGSSREERHDSHLHLHIKEKPKNPERPPSPKRQKLTAPKPGVALAIEDGLQDKTIKCRDCSAEFTHSAQAQRDFRAKNYEHEPKSCPACRKTRSARGRGQSHQ